MARAPNILSIPSTLASAAAAAYDLFVDRSLLAFGSDA